jgi:uncharacterized protein (TIGR03000 family)
MLKHWWSILGGTAITAAALLMGPGKATAQHHGGGGGGHSAGPAASSHGGGHEGGGSWGGREGWGGGWEGGRGWGGYSGFGFGYPGYGGYGRGWGNYGWYSPGYYGGYYNYGYPYSSYDYSYSPNYYGFDNSYVPDYSGDYNAPSYYSPDVQPSAPDNRAHLRVRVPADAQLWFEDHATSQTGSVRTFTSPELTPGHTYTYDLRARWRQGGQDVTQTRQVVVQPGQRVSVDFLRPMPGNPQLNQPPRNELPLPRETNPANAAQPRTNPPPAPAPRQ